MSTVTTDALAAQVRDARARSIALIADLTDEQLTVPYLATLNPFLWEVCHLAYFQELWVLRRGAGLPAAREDVDDLFDSITVGHESRWRLPMPSRDDAMRYVRSVGDRVIELLQHPDPLDDRLRYWIAYSIAHEDMHAEALTYARQTVGHPAPQLTSEPSATPSLDEARGDAEVPGGRFLLGATPAIPFCHDNEKWAHPVDVAPFAMARGAVTEGEFAAFIDDGGYARSELWAPLGWAWRLAENADLPIYWRRDRTGFEVRSFDRWIPIETHRALCHVSWFEADAFCRWAGRRLPTETEWEAASCVDPRHPATSADKPRYPWGDADATAAHCNMDSRTIGTVDVRAHAAGDSACGLRQMIGNVWEWTSTTFHPYPGFTPDMYADYSQTCFGTRKVLRGGCWATRSRMIRNTWRNFYQPGRRDVFAGFRTCALD